MLKCFQFHVFYYLLLFSQDVLPGHRDWLEVLGAVCVIIGSILTPVIITLGEHMGNTCYYILTKSGNPA